MKTVFFNLFLAAVLALPGQLAAGIVLGSQYSQMETTRYTSIPLDNGKTKKLTPEFNGGFGGCGYIEVPFFNGFFGFAAHSCLYFTTHDVSLNRYSVEYYEFYLDQNGEEFTTFQKGSKKDQNVTADLEQYLRNNNVDRKVSVEDLTLMSTLLFKFNFPVDVPGKNSFSRYTSIVLGILNPFLSGGIGNSLISRSFRGLNYIDEDKNVLEINGRDPAPDPDFHLVYGGGLNLRFPGFDFLGNQVLVVVEYLRTRNLSPDDQSKPFDDGYTISEEGGMLRIGTALLLE